MIIKCQTCQDEFEAKRAWSKFCSEKCRNTFHNGKRDIIIKCPHCLTEDFKMFEELKPAYYLCNVCAREFYDV